MKKFLILLLIVFGVQSLINAQVPSTAQTKIVYNFTKQKYEVFAKFDVTVNPLLIGVSKVSVILPSSTQDLQLQNIVSFNGGTWDDKDLTYNYTDGKDYHGVGNPGGGSIANVVAGQDILLFDFTLPGGGCNPLMRLWTSGLDADVTSNNQTEFVSYMNIQPNNLDIQTTNYGTQYPSCTQGCPTITLTPSSLSNGTKNTSYSATITASGGVSPYTYSVSGVLPTGLALNASTGLISGIPSVAGTFNFNITATDNTTPTSCSSNLNYSITIVDVLTISEVTPDGTTNTPYSGGFASATGGVGPYTYSVSAGSLPTGLAINPTTGAITGTPTVAGTSNFTLKVTDNNGNVSTIQANITIASLPCPTISVLPTTLPSGTLGSIYSTTLTASGGTATYTYTLTSGTLPTGLTLTNAGVISGTPSGANGTYTFSVKVVDANNCETTVQKTITIGCTTTTPKCATMNVTKN